MSEARRKGLAAEVPGTGAGDCPAGCSANAPKWTPGGSRGRGNGAAAGLSGALFYL